METGYAANTAFEHASHKNHKHAKYLAVSKQFIFTLPSLPHSLLPACPHFIGILRWSVICTNANLKCEPRTRMRTGAHLCWHPHPQGHPEHGHEGHHNTANQWRSNSPNNAPWQRGISMLNDSWKPRLHGSWLGHATPTTAGDPEASEEVFLNWMVSVLSITMPYHS